jgi:hypothetical protein
MYNWNSGSRMHELVCEDTPNRNEITCVRNIHQGEGAGSVKRIVATGWSKAVYVWKDPPDLLVQQAYRKLDPGSPSADIASLAWIPAAGLLAIGQVDGAMVSWQTSGAWRRTLRKRVSGHMAEGHEVDGIFDEAGDAKAHVSRTGGLEGDLKFEEGDEYSVTSHPLFQIDAPTWLFLRNRDTCCGPDAGRYF